MWWEGCGEGLGEGAKVDVEEAMDVGRGAGMSVDSSPSKVRVERRL